VDTGSTASYAYNALNQRVQTTVGSTVTEFVFNAAGQRVSTWNGSTNAQIQGQYYWGSKPVGFYKGGAAHFQHQDWLGTERMRTTYNGSVEGSFTSLPFGDDLTTASGTDTDAYHTATLDHDAESETDHAQFRQYNNDQGRWMAPDPYSGSYDFSNPQSMNRYVYTSNNPLASADPSGLMDPVNIWELMNISSAAAAYNQGAVTANGGGVGSTIGEFDEMNIPVTETETVATITMPAFRHCGPDSCMSFGGLSYQQSTFPIGSLFGFLNEPTIPQFPASTPPQPPSVPTPAPNNAGPSRWSCVWSAVKTEGISFGTDALGAIPGEGQGLAIAQLTAGGIGFVNSLYHSDAGGAVGAVVGDQTVLVGMAAKQMGVDALKVVPVAGNLLSAGLAVRDVVHGVEDYNGCMEGH
jgi:RHS repeat-associated protein